MPQTLRQIALDLFQAAIDAADPARALRRQFAGTRLTASEGGDLIVIAVGKAACPMLAETLAHIDPSVPLRALGVTNPENLAPIDRALVLPAGHPVPNEDGLIASQAVIDLLATTTPKTRVIALISGGGSALLPAPSAGVSLADKARVSEILLGTGCDIEQMNHIRQQLSQLKGGGFLRHAAPAQVESYILSDVVGDDLRVIASGPTVAPIGTTASARALLSELGVWDEMPSAVQTVLSQDSTPAPLPAAQNTLICSNRQSLEAMKAACTGFHAQIINDRLEGNVADVAPMLVEIAAQAPRGEPIALIFGGETTVTLTGGGRGGRNQDLALRFAHLARDLPGEWVFLSGGTDGRDGPTDAAGGLVDDQTTSRLATKGLNPQDFLDNNDSYAALQAADDLIITGGTGTNVADVQVFLRG